MITGDEKWITYENIVRKRQWVDKNQEPQPDAKANFHGRNVVCVFGKTAKESSIMNFSDAMKQLQLICMLNNSNEHKKNLLKDVQ